jgi:hypothetical protein
LAAAAQLTISDGRGMHPTAREGWCLAVVGEKKLEKKGEGQILSLHLARNNLTKPDQILSWDQS